MFGKKLMATALFAVIMLSAGAEAKMTVYDRQVALTKEIATAEKSKELTTKEAEKLRSRLEGIEERKQKMLQKNGNKLSYKDTDKIEKSLNSVSVELQKLRLAKRVQ